MAGERRPSASLRTRRPSTAYNEGDDSPSAIPDVPSLPPNHLSPYFTRPPGFPDGASGGLASYPGSATAPAPGAGPGGSRPNMRHAKSSETSQDGRSRSRGGASSAAGAGPGAGGGAIGGDSSKVGAYLLNKRQSVSFGRATAADIRAGVRNEAMPAVPAGYAPIASTQGPPRGYNDAIGRTGGPGGTGQRPGHGHALEPGPGQGHGQAMIQPGGHRRGGSVELATAGEELISKAPRGPTGNTLHDLLKEDFVADSFIKSHLSPGAAANASVQLDDLRKLKLALTHMLDATQENLQKNVIQNYAEFIKVSKDIAALENEMLELKSVLEEWKTVPEGLEVEQSFDPSSSTGAGTGGGRVNRRNSLADLQALYRTQLEALWEGVEGSQRFLPAAPGRHVLSRHNGWAELHNATYRPRQGVILFLLNDALLVGVEKRRQMGKSVRVVADRCFHLNEIAVTDLKDQGESLTNAIRIKKDREIFIFRTDRGEEKRALLGQFKKILEETMNRKRKESVWEAEARRDTGSYGSSRAGGGAGASKHPLAGFDPSAHFSFITSSDATGKDLSWIDDISDELAVHIALREFEQAVLILEKGRALLPQVEADPLAAGVLRGKLEGRTAELCAVLLAGLGDTSVRKTGVVKISGWLLRLGQGERARETFLAGRGELLKSRTGEIRFASSSSSSQQGGAAAEDREEGAGALPEMDPQMLVDEVAELSFVCFTLIRNTCEWYMAAYKDHQTASAFVRWASTQVEVFSDIFKRQVYSSRACDGATKQRCVDTATAQAAMLKDVGLDFAFLLSSSLQYAPPPLPPRERERGQEQAPEENGSSSRTETSETTDTTLPLQLGKRKKSTGELKASALPVGGQSRPGTSTGTGMSAAGPGGGRVPVA